MLAVGRIVLVSNRVIPYLNSTVDLYTMGIRFQFTNPGPSFGSLPQYGKINKANNTRKPSNEYLPILSAQSTPAIKPYAKETRLTKKARDTATLCLVDNGFISEKNLWVNIN